MPSSRRQYFAHEPLVLERNRPIIDKSELSPVSASIYETLRAQKGPMAVSKLLSAIELDGPPSHELLLTCYEEVLAIGGLRMIQTFPYHPRKSTVCPTVELVDISRELQGPPITP